MLIARSKINIISSTVNFFTVNSLKNVSIKIIISALCSYHRRRANAIKFLYLKQKKIEPPALWIPLYSIKFRYELQVKDISICFFRAKNCIFPAKPIITGLYGWYRAVLGGKKRIGRMPIIIVCQASVNSWVQKNYRLRS